MERDKKKVMVFMPDGVGLKNFVLTSFFAKMKNENLDVVYWNNTSFDLSKFGITSRTINYSSTNIFSDILKNAKRKIYLNLFFKRSQNGNYKCYGSPISYKGTIKNKFKAFCSTLLVSVFTSEKGVLILNKWVLKNERATHYFKKAVSELQQVQPSVLLCTNQRTSLAIAPVEAAKSLGIKTACFIFSWDNMPKAMLLVETDYYLVWSSFMKQEMLTYYPQIHPDQIIVTGTPQFENHLDSAALSDRASFYKAHDLNPSVNYLCFSGDDVTTSPHDHLYLADAAQAVLDLNAQGHNYGIIFRKCPTDISTRYDAVLEKYKGVIVAIAPLWEKFGSQWNTVMPTAADLVLQANILKHTLGVINIGSSMVFDAICHNKPCGYLNYNVTPATASTWNIHKLYKYIHFQSMASPDAVFWINSKQDIATVILDMTHNNALQLKEARKWFELITKTQASSNMVQFLKDIA